MSCFYPAPAALRKYWANILAPRLLRDRDSRDPLGLEPVLRLRPAGQGQDRLEVGRLPGRRRLRPVSLRHHAGRHEGHRAAAASAARGRAARPARRRLRRAAVRPRADRGHLRHRRRRQSDGHALWLPRLHAAVGPRAGLPVAADEILDIVRAAAARVDRGLLPRHPDERGRGPRGEPLRPRRAELRRRRRLRVVAGRRAVGVRELQAGTSDMALAMGADTVQTPFAYMAFSKTFALSPQGRCRPFDAEADGIVLSEGIGVVVLKRLADAERDGDRIYAVIRGVGDLRATAATKGSPRPTPRARCAPWSAPTGRRVSRPRASGWSRRTAPAPWSATAPRPRRWAGFSARRGAEPASCAVGLGQVDDRPQQVRRGHRRPDQDDLGAAPQGAAADAGGKAESTGGLRGRAALPEHRAASVDSRRRRATLRRRQRVSASAAPISTSCSRNTPVDFSTIRHRPIASGTPNW